MKQCPNPNCILYTRLEELPDAYTKCPGCGGQLVDASMPSGKLHSGYLTRLPGGGLGPDDLDEEPAEEAGREEPGYVATAAPPVPQTYDDEYYPYEDTEQDESVKIQPPVISRGARIAYILALLLLLFSCVLFFVVIGSRVFSSNSVAPVDATETAVVALQPAVNTPVPVMPTVPQSSLPPVQPTSTTAVAQAPPPTLAPPTEPPTATAPPPAQQLPPTQAPPTQAPVPPTPVVAQPQGVPPTAPPAQPAPIGGVTNAQMVTGLAAGQSQTGATAYHAGDAFVLAVQAHFGPGGVTTMNTRWYGPDGGLLYEIPRTFNTAGTYYTGFTLRKDSPWLTGGYRVDIYTNNSPNSDDTVSFSVVP